MCNCSKKITATTLGDTIDTITTEIHETWFVWDDNEIGIYVRFSVSTSGEYKLKLYSKHGKLIKTITTTAAAGSSNYAEFLSDWDASWSMNSLGWGYTVDLLDSSERVLSSKTGTISNLCCIENPLFGGCLIQADTCSYVKKIAITGVAALAAFYVVKSYVLPMIIKS